MVFEQTNYELGRISEQDHEIYQAIVQRPQFLETIQSTDRIVFLNVLPEECHRRILVDPLDCV